MRRRAGGGNAGFAGSATAKRSIISNMKSESRRYKRFKVDVMEMNGTMMFANEVEILDISIGGISFKADRRLNIGVEYALKIRDKSSVIPLRGSVIWSRLSGTKRSPEGGIPLYTAGMKFTDLSAETVGELARFIAGHRDDSLGGEDMHCLSGLRFNIRYGIDQKEKAVLNYRESYRVRKISMGGMLIESAHEIEVEKRMPMEVSLPGNDLIMFEGRVASCLLTNQEETKCFDVGIEFIDMPESDRARLAEFIRTLTEADTDSCQ